MDVIFSQACFEHFANPDGSIKQIARLLRRGGISSHQIDLRDHRNFEQPLEFLVHSETVWNLSYSNIPDGVHNRWRASEYRAAFEKYGLETISFEATRKTEVTEEMRDKFHKHFRSMSLEELSILGILVLSRKP